MCENICTICNCVSPHFDLKLSSTSVSNPPSPVRFLCLPYHETSASHTTWLLNTTTCAVLTHLRVSHVIVMIIVMTLMLMMVKVTLANHFLQSKIESPHAVT
jgi:hypothetical protein